MGIDAFGIQHFSEQITKHITFLLQTRSEELNYLTSLLKNSTRVFLIGNGGSHSICEHMATDLNKRCDINAITLSSAGYITCLGNDYGFKNVYREWLKQNIVDSLDVVVAISSSGKSKDITRALKYCNDRGIPAFGISGMDGFDPTTVDYNIHIDSYNYGEIEMTTEVLLHGIIENELVK